MSCSHVVVAEVERGDFGKSGKDSNWEEKQEALCALQRLFDEAGKLEVPADKGAEAAFDAEAWRALRLPLQSCLKDLRSGLVKEACALLVCVATACNTEDGAPRAHVSRDGARQCLREAAPTLLELMSSGNRVNAKFVDDCMLAIIARCRFKSLVGNVAEYAVQSRRGKSAYVREACGNYARGILEQWGSAYLGKDEACVRQLGSTIASLLEDSSERARAAARAAFVAYDASWPDRGATLIERADPRVARLLSKARPPQNASAPEADDAPPPPPRPRTAAKPKTSAAAESAKAAARRLQLSARAAEAPSPAAAAPPSAPAPADPAGVRAGDRVRAQRNKTGVARYVGATSFSSGDWIGVELDATDGKHDGVVNGTRYFTCDARRGLFVRPSQCRRLDDATAASPVPPLANKLCCAHKHLLKSLMTSLQGQLRAIGDFEASAITVDTASAYADAAAAAAPPLAELLAAYELGVEELKAAAARDPPASPPKRDIHVDVELTRVPDEADSGAPVEVDDDGGEAEDVDIDVDEPAVLSGDATA